MLTLLFRIILSDAAYLLEEEQYKQKSGEEGALRRSFLSVISSG